jgi:hypothetical protein
MLKLSRTSQSKFVERFRKLFQLNSFRANELFEITQVTLLYGLIGFYCGTFTNRMFPKFDKSRPTLEILFEILGETVMLSILVYYIHLFIKIIPVFKFNESSNFVPSMIGDFEGEIALSVIFISLQTNLIEKIQELSKRIVGDQ